MSVWTIPPAILINIVFACVCSSGRWCPRAWSVAGSAGPLIRFARQCGWTVRRRVAADMGCADTCLRCAGAVRMPDRGRFFQEGRVRRAPWRRSMQTSDSLPVVRLGQASATIGIISGVIGGIVLIQWERAEGTRELGEQDSVSRTFPASSRRMHVVPSPSAPSTPAPSNRSRCTWPSRCSRCWLDGMLQTALARASSARQRAAFPPRDDRRHAAADDRRPHRHIRVA